MTTPNAYGKGLKCDTLSGQNGESCTAQITENKCLHFRCHRFSVRISTRAAF